jgi:hypothetical protein
MNPPSILITRNRDPNWFLELFRAGKLQRSRAAMAGPSRVGMGPIWCQILNDRSSLHQTICVRLYRDICITRG